jgi:FlgD Ig-like domain
MRAFLLVAPLLLLLANAPARAAGPIWTVRDIDQFQDNFASDGTVTGSVRADMANDILPASSPGILPGDSSVVVITDPVFGLAADGVLGGKAVYCYVAVQPFGQPGKVGAALSGGSRWPVAGTQVVNGITWTKLRFDQSDVGGGPVPDNFCMDLNDNLFTPGDTIFFFYAAKSADGPGTTNYFSLEFGTTTDIGIAAALPMEFTCLPAGGFAHGGDLLYIDGAEGTDSQVYWDLAFKALGALKGVDRYDVRGPSDGGNNRLASRVVDIAQQLNNPYRLIYWDCDSLSITLGDGSGSPVKTDDYQLIDTFLDNLTSSGTVLLFGNDVAEQLNASSSPSAALFKQAYMPYVLVSGSQVPAYGLAPTCVHWAGRRFEDDFMVYGGSPGFADFDVFQASGTSQLQMTYGPSGVTNGAVVSNRAIIPFNGNAAVLLAGFGLSAIRDDDTNGISDRARFLRDAGRINGAGPLNFPVGTGALPVNSLQQNRPNPFNPQTTIAFSIKARGHVGLSIYDVGGRLVRTLANETRAAGAYQLTWDGRDARGQAVASGVYFYRLVAPEFTKTRKMVLLK